MLKEKEKKLEVPYKRYKILFSFDNAYAVFHKKDDSDGNSSSDFDCTYYANHNNVFPGEVLVDVMYRIRSGDFQWLESKDIVCVRVNGQLLSYRFEGIQSWNPKEVFSNFTPLGSRFFQEEKEDIIKKLHKNGMVLDVLTGSIISLKDDDELSKCDFYGIEKEAYPIKALSMISEYSVYSLEGDRIIRVNPNGNPFYDLKNALFFFLKKCKGKRSSILLFNRKELEIIKDHMDLKAKTCV